MTMTSDLSEIADSLQWFGLTNYEANVFVALQQLGKGTAKDIAEISGVPRSQIYGAADSLKQQGLVEVQQSNPRVYRPIAVNDAVEHLTQKFESKSSEIKTQLQAIQSTEQSQNEQKEEVWTVNGTAAIQARTTKIIDNAQESLVVGLTNDSPLVNSIKTHLTGKTENDIEVEIVVDSDELRSQFAGLGRITQQDQLTEQDTHAQLVIISDSNTILLSVKSQSDEIAIWSSGTNFAKVLIELARGGMKY